MFGFEALEGVESVLIPGSQFQRRSQGGDQRKGSVHQDVTYGTGASYGQRLCRFVVVQATVRLVGEV